MQRLCRDFLHAAEPGTQEGMWQGDRVITSFCNVGGYSVLTPPQGRKEGQAKPIWKALFAEGKKSYFSRETDTLIYIGSVRELAGEEVFTNGQWAPWPSKWPTAISHLQPPRPSMASSWAEALQKLSFHIWLYRSSENSKRAKGIKIVGGKKWK